MAKSWFINIATAVYAIIKSCTVGLVCYAGLNLCDFLVKLEYYAIFIYVIIP